MSNEIEARISHELLTWARKRLALTIEDAADKIEVTLKQLTDWEKGIAFPTMDQLFVISEVYGLPASMFYLTEIPKPSLLKKDKKAKSAFKYLKSKGFTPDDYLHEWSEIN